MTGHEYVFWFLITAIPIVVAGAVSWGFHRGSMSNYVTWSEHRNVCHQKSQETNDMLREIRADIKILMVKSGYIEGKVEDSK